MLYFGTDGIRQRSDFFTAEFLDSVAHAAAFLSDNDTIVIGRDTRISGKFIEERLAESLRLRGKTVVCIGIAPTPVLARYIRDRKAGYGIMITASHNPPEYNGVKFFDILGKKISEEEEKLFETAMAASEKDYRAGGKILEENGIDKYIDFIKTELNPDIKGLKVFLDTANGAAVNAAPAVFEALGAKVTVINTETDGRNINVGCGATHPEVLIEAMSKGDYDIGFTYDGDADRVMAVKDGKLLDGDHIMYTVARYFQERGMLSEPAAVGTVMTNFGTERAFMSRGIKLIRAKVGDKHVIEEMFKRGCPIGGETSGHLIFTRYQNTGDGILSSLLAADIDVKRALIALDDIEEYPSVSDDIITVPERVDAFKANEEIKGYLKEIEKDTETRIVVRASGTEPRVRIMAEAPTKERAASLAAEIKSFILARI